MERALGLLIEHFERRASQFICNEVTRISFTRHTLTI